MSNLPVLCCCHPDNELGSAPDDLPYPRREWIDEEGNTGFAYPSDAIAIPSGWSPERAWQQIPGVVLGKKKPKPKKPKPGGTKRWK